MVHKVVLKSEEGFVVEDGEPLLLTKREYDTARKRFIRKYEGSTRQEIRGLKK
jgi:hypothetical protein